MYIERVPNRNSPPAVLLRESWRENGKTKKRTVGNLSSLPDQTVEAIRSALKGDVVPAAMAIAEARIALELGLPVVNLSAALKDAGLPRVTVDHRAVGQLAAEHLLERGFRRFAGFLEQLYQLASRPDRGPMILAELV